MGHLGMILVALVVLLISILRRLLVHLVWRPRAITETFRKQGVRGPAYHFFSGSVEEIKSITRASKDVVLDNHSHDITTRVLPEFHKWSSQYGDTFLFWLGPQPRLYISDPELVKQVLANKFGFYTKIVPNPNIVALLGKGLILAGGSDWARHRKVLNPAFSMDKLKMLTTQMSECAEAMLEGWQNQANQATDRQKEIEVSGQFKELTADIISRTAFGSSYVEGKEVFMAQEELQKLFVASRLDINIPGAKYIPTKTNLYRWKLEREVRSKLMGIVRGRLDSTDSSYGNDLLGLMIEASKKEEDQLMMSMEEIIDECKTFFFAGHETTSSLLAWAMFLLSTNQQWQERLREEVLTECGTTIPNADMLSKLKLVNMVLLETMRLYGPVLLLSRKAAKDMNLGSLKVPKDTVLAIPIVMIHRSKEMWGDDAYDFNPLRFENGTTKAAKHPNALLGFSIGPRACIGQNFAMLEAKMAVAMILQRFSFALSPNYKHTPAQSVTLIPKHGLPIVFRPLL